MCVGKQILKNVNFCIEGNSIVRSAGTDRSHNRSKSVGNSNCTKQILNLRVQQAKPARTQSLENIAQNIPSWQEIPLGKGLKRTSKIVQTKTTLASSCNVAFHKSAVTSTRTTSDLENHSGLKPKSDLSVKKESKTTATEQLPARNKHFLETDCTSNRYLEITNLANQNFQCRAESFCKKYSLENIDLSEKETRNHDASQLPGKARSEKHTGMAKSEKHNLKEISLVNRHKSSTTEEKQVVPSPKKELKIGKNLSANEVISNNVLSSNNLGIEKEEQYARKQLKKASEALKNIVKQVQFSRSCVVQKNLKHNNADKLSEIIVVSDEENETASSAVSFDSEDPVDPVKETDRSLALLHLAGSTSCCSIDMDMETSDVKLYPPDEGAGNSFGSISCEEVELPRQEESGRIMADLYVEGKAVGISHNPVDVEGTDCLADTVYEEDMVKGDTLLGEDEDLEIIGHNVPSCGGDGVNTENMELTTSLIACHTDGDISSNAHNLSFPDLMVTGKRLANTSTKQNLRRDSTEPKNRSQVHSEKSNEKPTPKNGQDETGIAIDDKEFRSDLHQLEPEAFRLKTSVMDTIWDLNNLYGSTKKSENLSTVKTYQNMVVKAIAGITSSMDMVGKMLQYGKEYEDILSKYLEHSEGLERRQLPVMSYMKHCTEVVNNMNHILSSFLNANVLKEPQITKETTDNDNLTPLDLSNHGSTGIAILACSGKVSKGDVRTSTPDETRHQNGEQSKKHLFLLPETPIEGIPEPSPQLEPKGKGPFAHHSCKFG